MIPGIQKQRYAVRPTVPILLASTQTNLYRVRANTITAIVILAKHVRNDWNGVPERGVGKSTLSRLVAREYANAGWKVKIADLDISQGTSTDWKQRREQNALQPEVAVEPFRTVDQAVRVASLYDLLVFDGPPHSMAGTKEIARVSDVVVLPSGLSLDDLKPMVLLAHELSESGIEPNKIAFALCRVGDRENEISEARSYIRKAGYTVMNGEIPERTAYRRASDEGRALSETPHPTLRVRTEQLAQSIIDLVTTQQKARKRNADTDTTTASNRR